MIFKISDIGSRMIMMERRFSRMEESFIKMAEDVREIKGRKK
jgi:hypothetical protein